MSSFSPKSQFYRYSLKTAGLKGNSWCGDIAWLYLRPPEDAQSIESMYCRFRLRFDAGVAVGDRILEKVGISSSASLFDTPDYERELEINQAADGDRYVDISIDLSTLLKKDNVKFQEDFGDFSTQDFTFVYIKLPYSLRNNLSVGTIELWKLDGMFTTKEIR